MLSIQQKSVYLIIFNATMIARSLGKTLKEEELKKYKVELFNQLDNLTGKIDNETLKESDILKAIEDLANQFNISWGQSQKAINVILKYHLLLNSKQKSKSVLHCPLDSIILKELEIKPLSLAKMDKNKYLEIQTKINERYKDKIDFDIKWDKIHLEDEGIL